MKKRVVADNRPKSLTGIQNGKLTHYTCHKKVTCVNLENDFHYKATGQVKLDTYNQDGCKQKTLEKPYESRLNSVPQNLHMRIVVQDAVILLKFSTLLC